ncbi:hypothetical protein [Ferruginibacter sp. SUN106]|uniref:hypothetical protein n=1 Tax=Ferruginibacter sp. SUN106 TaxID=2978348 RepID=UPI003D35A1BA
MKVRFLLMAGALFLGIVFSSCHWHRHYHDVSVSINDDEDIYQLTARFDDNKTRAIENYIHEYTDGDNIFQRGGHGNMDATLILDDESRVYIKSREGCLKIKFNKEENSEEAYERVKDMCEGIKEILAKN